MCKVQSANTECSVLSSAQQRLENDNYTDNNPKSGLLTEVELEKRSMNLAYENVRSETLKWSILLLLGLSSHQLLL